jgi:hypothetical protein
VPRGDRSSRAKDLLHRFALFLFAMLSAVFPLANSEAAGIGARWKKSELLMLAPSTTVGIPPRALSASRSRRGPFTRVGRSLLQQIAALPV